MQMTHRPNRRTAATPPPPPLREQGPRSVASGVASRSPQNSAATWAPTPSCRRATPLAAPPPLRRRSEENENKIQSASAAALLKQEASAVETQDTRGQHGTRSRLQNKTNTSISSSIDKRWWGEGRRGGRAERGEGRDVPLLPPHSPTPQHHPSPPRPPPATQPHPGRAVPKGPWAPAF